MSLMRADLTPYSGDGLLVYDTDTKFEWLNLGLTREHSCVDAQSLRFVTRERFRFATLSEVGTLVANAGITLTNGPGGPGSGTPANAIGVGTLLFLLGGYIFSPPVLASRGLVAPVPFGATTPVVAFDLHLNLGVTPASAYSDTGPSGMNASQRDQRAGVVLVRSRP